MSEKGKQMHYLPIFASLLLLYLASGSARASQSDDETFGIVNGRVVSKLNKKNIAKGQMLLKQVTDRNIPAELSDGIVVDGEVLKKLESDSQKQLRWLFRVKHIYVGKDQIKNSQIEVKSPTINDGGTMLQVNENYRLYLMDVGLVFLNKPSGFYFWKGTTLKINRDGRKLSPS